MRQAFNDVGWLLQPPDTEPFGFSLGFDFCAEHEHGAPYLKEALGVAPTDFPLGVEDRTMTEVPEDLEYGEYELHSKDRRVKRTTPAALLYLARARHWSDWPDAVGERAKLLDVGFRCDAGDRFYAPEHHDLASAWSGDSGFAIHVRGAENVARLRALHEAFRRKAVALADASGMGFVRKALSLVIVDRLSEDVKTMVRDRDQAHLRLHEAFEVTGIRERLKAAGKRWYALVPRWSNGEGSDLLAFLNPCEQRRYDSGWYTLDELEDWAQERGPVVDGLAVSLALRSFDADWSFHLVTGLADAGIGLKRQVCLWVDDARTVPGLRLQVTENARDKLASGVYPLAALRPYIERGQTLHAADKARRASQGETAGSAP
jgi:hypothetical protein